MNVFIAHAEADQAVADELKAFLRQRGLTTETETGERGFHHLQSLDVVVALWSRAATFSPWRMVMEKRMLEAWADQRLVLVKLDHDFLPVGLRDLPAIDASFDKQRELVNWPEVARRAKESMTARLVGMQAPPAPTALSTGMLAAPSIGERPEPGSFQAGFAGGVTRGRATPKARKRGGGGLFGVFRKKAARTEDISEDFEAPQPAFRSAPAAAAAPSPPPPPRPAPELFVSYAHADDAAVQPVVKVVEENGRTVWIDKGGIQAGEGWAGEIVRGIRGAKGVMVMCSPRAFESDHIKREVYLADRFKKPMLPIFLEQAEMPDDFQFFFASVQWLELWKLPEAERASAIGQALKAV